MIISKENIENYIPQREPFIMIDNLVEATAEIFKSDFWILQDNIFIENGVLREFGLIENIAQSSLVGLAFIKSSSGQKNAGGFIGSITNLNLYGLPRANNTINTIVYLIAKIGNMFLLKGENYLNGNKLLECEIKVVGSQGL